VNTIAKRLFMIAAVALLPSCSPPVIDISVASVGGRTRLTLSQDWGLIFSDKQTPCVREVSVRNGPDTYDRKNAVWLIETKGDVQCLDLATVAVGTVPNGWQQVVPLRAVRGRSYTVRTDGIGWGETHVTF